MPNSEGYIFIANIYPKAGDTFQIKKRFKFTYSGKSITSTTIIDIEIYVHDIIVLSFFDKNHSDSDDKYKLRSGLGSGHTRAIFKACLAVYLNQPGENALVFIASNDVNEKREDNSRNSAYGLFLRRHLPEYKDYVRLGSLRINSVLLYHRNRFQYQREAQEFLIEFEKKSESNL